MGMVIPLIPTLYGARAVSIIDRLRIRECKSCYSVSNICLSDGNAFLFTEIGKVDWVLGLAFWTLGADVADRI